jgi:hypothetical protein
MPGTLHPPFPDEADMQRLALDVPQIAQETFADEPFQRFPPRPSGQLSLVRQWLGDEPCLYLAYWKGPDTDRARRLFSEAIVLVSRRPYKDAAAEHGWRMPPQQ